MDTKDAAYEALHDTVIELMDSFAKLQYKVDLMEPLTPGRLPSAEEFDTLHNTVMELMIKVNAICDKLTEEFVDIRKRVDAVDDTLAEKIIELQNRVDKLETK